MLGEIGGAGVADLRLVPGSQGWQAAAAAQMQQHVDFGGVQMPGQISAWPAARSEQWQPPSAAAPGMQYLHPGMMQPGGGRGVYASAMHTGPGSWQGTYSAPPQMGMLGTRSSAMGPPPPPPPLLLTSQFQCEICHIQCNSQINLDQHLASRKHLQRAARLAAAGVEAAAKEARAVLGIKKGPGITYVGPNAVVHSLCKQMIVPELNAVVNELLSRVRAFQHRAVARNALKAAAHCWYVCGLREVRKAVRLGRAQSVIVAPNIEEMDHMTGLDGHLQDILSISASQSVPVVFALTRKRLGKIYGCRKRVSAVALLDYHGVEALHERMIQLVQEGHEAWEKLHASGDKQPHILVDEGGGEAGDDDDDDDEEDDGEEYEVGNDGNAVDGDVLELAD